MSETRRKPSIEQDTPAQEPARDRVAQDSIFTRLVQELLTDDEYRELQSSLVRHPDLGPVIQGSGGLRKVRWALPGKGKSGGVRVIYYLVTVEQILMVFIYSKSRQDDLTPDQLRRLRRMIEEER